jgi:hypothetical protein
MATNTDALRTIIGAIVMSDAAQKVDFYLDKMHVDGSGLSYVALALASKPRGGRGLSIAVGGLGPHAEASYDPSTNTFKFPKVNYGTVPFERMTIFHESVHVWRDSVGRTVATSSGKVKTRDVSEEAAAFLAGALFFLYDAGPTSASDTTPTWAKGVYDNALCLALQVAGQSNPKGCNVNEFNQIGVDALKEGIRKNRAYRGHLTGRYDNNGVRL